MEQVNNVTFNRIRSPIKIFLDGLKCGEIWRGEGRRNYLLSLEEVCWRNGEPAIGGATVKSFHTIREAKAEAKKYAPKVLEFREIRNARRRTAQNEQAMRLHFAEL